MTDTNLDVYGSEAPPSVDIQAPAQETKQPSPSSNLPGVLQSAVSAGAGALSNIYGAGVMASQHPYNPAFDILGHGTGIPWVDDKLGKIRPITPMPEVPRFTYDNPIVHTLQDAQKAFDYNQNTYPGQTLGSMVEKASKTSEEAFGQNKGEAGKNIAMSGLAPLAAKFANEDWAKAGDFLSNEVVKGVVNFAPVVLASMSGVGTVPALTYMGLSAMGAAENEGRAAKKPVAQREAYALAEGIMNPLIWNYIPKGLMVFAQKLTASFGMKMASSLLKESIRDTLSKEIGDLANNPQIQNWITMRANQVSSMLMQHVFDMQRRTIKQAFAEFVQQGVVDVVTLGFIRAPYKLMNTIKNTYQNGGKEYLQELLFIDEGIKGIKNGFEDATGKKITQPQVVPGGTIHLESMVDKLINSGSFIDNPKAVSYIEALKNSLKLQDQRGSIASGLETTPSRLDAYLAKKAGVSEDLVVNRPFDVKLEGSDKGTARSLRSEYVGMKNEQVTRGVQLAEAIKRLVPEKLDRQGLFWLKAAEGKTEILNEAIHDPKFSGYHEQLKRALEVAKDPQKMQALGMVEKYYDQAGKIGLDTGALKAIRENYQKRLYVPKPPQDYVKTEMKSGLRQTTSMAKHRVYNTEFDAVENGEQFASTDIADNMQLHNEEMARVNTSRKLADHMVNSKLASWAGHDETPPRDWTKVGMSKEGKELYAPKEISKGMKAITDPDFTSKIDALRNLKHFQGLVKTVDLSLSFFHHLTLAAQSLYQGNVKGLAAAPHLDTALQSQEFKNLELDFVRNEGMVSTVNANADIMRSLSTKQGDGLDKLTQLPVAKQYLQLAEKSSDWLFGKYQRYLKVMDYGKKISNWVADHPQASNDEVTAAKKGFSREINSAYGGQNWEAQGVDKSTLSLLKLTLLAPDWVVSNIKLPAAALTDWQSTEGQAARASLVTGIAGGIAATAFLNQVITGHSILKNKKGHMFQIEIAPDVYFDLLRGAPGEIVKLYGMMVDSGPARGINRYAQGKLSPVLSKIMGSLENVKYSNIPIIGPKRKKETDAQYAVRGTLAYTAYWAGLFPVPFGVSGAYNYLANEPKKTALGAMTTATGLARYSAPSKKKTTGGVSGLDLSSDIEKSLSKAFSMKEANAAEIQTSKEDKGKVSFYGVNAKREHLNKMTAYNEVFDPKAMTAASYAYPHNTVLQVTNDENGKSVIVRVNDKGPNKRLGRKLDLTPAAFDKISDRKKGLGDFTIKVIGKRKKTNQT